MLDDEYRHYQTARLRVGLLVVYSWMAGGAATLVLLEANDSDSFPIATALVCAVVLVAGVLWGQRVTAQTGLEECSEGFIDRRNFGSRVLRRDDIERFDHRRVFSVDRVFAVRRGDGRGDPIQGLIQGRRVVWKGGETRDIVGVLNERLRAEPGRPP